MGLRDTKVRSWTILCRLRTDENNDRNVVLISNPPDHVAKVIQEYIDEVEKKGGFNATKDKEKG
jgi:hypothetical protein